MTCFHVIELVLCLLGVSMCGSHCKLQRSQQLMGLLWLGETKMPFHRREGRGIRSVLTGSVGEIHTMLEMESGSFRFCGIV